MTGLGYWIGEQRVIRKFSLLFDLDGTLADTDALHLCASQEVLRGCGSIIDEDFYRLNIAGRTNIDIIAEAFPQASLAEIQALAARRENLYRAGLADVRAVDGANEILSWARNNGLRCAVVTTSPRESVEAVLTTLGLLDLFSLLGVVDEVERGKPDPLPYLTALRSFGIEAGDAVAFEDSVLGITSACAAGLSAIGLLTSLNKEVLIAAGDVITAKDFRDKDMWGWLSAFEQRDVRAREQSSLNLGQIMQKGRGGIGSREHRIGVMPERSGDPVVARHAGASGRTTTS